VRGCEGGGATVSLALAQTTHTHTLSLTLSYISNDADNVVVSRSAEDEVVRGFVLKTQKTKHHEWTYTGAEKESCGPPTHRSHVGERELKCHTNDTINCCQRLCSIQLLHLRACAREFE
jgi:hypothetical protein